MFEHPAFAVFREALDSAVQVPDADGVVSDRRVSRSSIREIDTKRVSSKSLDKLDVHLDEGGRIYSEHPIVGPWFDRLPKDILTNDSDAYRRSFGLHRIELRHCHPSATSRARVGFAAVAGDGSRAVLILLVAHSAALDDIPTPERPLNAWAELVVAAWTWAESARDLRFQRDDRMNRSNAVFARIDEAVKARPGGIYHWGHHVINPHTDSWEAIITSNKSTQEAETAKIRRLAGLLRHIQDGLFVGSSIPVGLRRGTTAKRGREVEDKSVALCVDESVSGQLTKALASYANGWSKTRIAVDAAVAGARDGRGDLLLPKLIPILDKKEREEALTAVKQLVSKKAALRREANEVSKAVKKESGPKERQSARLTANTYVTRLVNALPLLRTGTLHLIRFGVIKGRTDYYGWQPTFVTTDTAMTKEEQNYALESDLSEDHPYWGLEEKTRMKARTYGFWSFSQHYGSPVELPDAVWEKIVERARRDAEQIQKRIATGRCRPITGLTLQPFGNQQFRIRHGGDTATYAIDVLDPTDPDTPSSHVHTISASHAAHQLGELILSVVEAAETATLPVVPNVCTAAVRVDPRQRELESLRRELERIEVRLTGYARDLAESEPGTRQAKAIVAARDADATRADTIEQDLIPDLQREIDANEPELDEQTVEVMADFTQLTAVGLGLLTCDPYGPAPLSDAVAWILDSGAGLSALRTGENDRQILIDVRVRIPLLDGTTEWIEAGTLDLTDRRITPTRRPETRPDVARRLMRDGDTIDSLTDRYGWEATVILSETAKWLSGHGMKHYQRQALLTAAAADSPPPSPAIIYAHLTGDRPALADAKERFGNWFVERVLQAYGPDTSWAHGTGWIRTPLTPWRALLAGIAAAGRSRYQNVIAAIDGIHSQQQLQDHLHPGRLSHWQTPATLNEGWIDLYRCQNPDCPAGQGTPLTGFLPVPELIVKGDALFCQYCWHSPTSPGPLPDPYRKLWDTTTIIASLKRGDGIPFIANTPPVPVIGKSFLTSQEAADQLGLTLATIQRYAKSGRIPSTKTATGKLRFNPDHLNTRAVKTLAKHSRGRRTPTGPLWNRHAVIDALQTDLITVRVLVSKGLLTNFAIQGRSRFDPAQVEGLLADLRTQLDQPDASFADVHLKATLAKRWNMSAHTVTKMISQGTLHAITLGTLTLIPNTAVQALNPRTRTALESNERLSADDVAKLAGIAPSTILHHALNGTLPSVQLYPRGRYYFLPDEVDLWLNQRRTVSASEDTDP